MAKIIIDIKVNTFITRLCVYPCKLIKWLGYDFKVDSVRKIKFKTKSGIFLLFTTPKLSGFKAITKAL